MDYKEKYNAALRRAKKLYGEGTITECLGWVFPELEDEDERIKRKILELVSISGNGNQYEEIKDWLEKQGEPEDRESDDELTWLKTFIEEEAYYLSMDIRDEIDRKKLINLQNALAWLEKQEKQKPILDFKASDWYVSKVDGKIHNMYYSVDKVEPKFHPGDWVVLTAGELSITLQIVNVDTNKKLYWFTDDSCLPIVDEECLHLWTIQDAKDGDVLASELTGSIFLFRGIKDNKIDFYCDYDTTFEFPDDRFGINDSSEHYGSVEESQDIHPATKEQRDTLIKAMADAGYAFDFEKKELKKIEQKPTNKVETKFKEGNYIVPDNITSSEIWRVINIDKDNYYNIQCITNPEYDEIYRIPGFVLEKDYRLWTIEDAKRGDVLVDAYGNIGMFDKCYDFDWMSFCSLGNNGGFQYFTVEHENEKTHPATKEQRDLLFTKMEEEGYEYDNEKKELKKIEHKFNVDDWIVTDDSFGKIVRHVDEIRFNIIDKGYVVSDENGLIYDISFSEEHKWHKWTIQDAEDGDLLAASDNSIFIYAGTDGSKAKFYVALTTFGAFNFQGGCWEDKDSVRPVTEEEHKTFFEKLKDQKLEWDLKGKCIRYMAFC